MMKPGSLTAMLRLPQPWPPEKEGIITSVVDEGTTALLVASSLGSLLIMVKSDEGLVRLLNFQQIQTEESPWIILSASWNDAGGSIRINGHELLKGDPCQLPPYIIEGKSNTLLERALVFPGLTRTSARNEAEALFLGTIIDIDHKIIERDWYTALRAGNLVRQLLTEGFLHRINQSYKLKIDFVVNDTEQIMLDMLTHGMDTVWLSCDPFIMRGITTICLDLDRFLAVKIIYHKGYYATILDVIRACSNSMGGVHFKPPKKGAEEAIIAFDQVVQSTGLPLSLNGLLGICGATLEAMRPLVHAING